MLLMLLMAADTADGPEKCLFGSVLFCDVAVFDYLATESQKLLLMAINYKVIGIQKPGTDLPADKKYYARLVRSQQVTEAEIAQMIADRCTVKAPDVRGVLTALEDEFIRQLQAGNSIELGDLGCFRPSVNGFSAAKPENLKVADIMRVHVVFTPRTLLKVELDQEDVVLRNIELSSQSEV